MEPRRPEELKELGNKAFAEKDYRSAISFYTQAIQLNPKNHVFFSNRSASHAGLQQWEAAVNDAKECIRLDPYFMKGYYRLATAQVELKQFDTAVATVKQGLSLDAKNPQLLQVMRSIKSEHRATKEAYGSFDNLATHELRDLQLQHAETAKEYNKLEANLSKLKREQRMNQLTLEELEKRPSTGAHFRSLGKIFVKQDRGAIFKQVKDLMEEQRKNETDLSQKLDFLRHRMESQQQNVRELTASG